METTCTVDEEGRITIPVEMLERAGFSLPARAIFSVEDDQIIFRRVRRPEEFVGMLESDEDDDDGPSATEMLRADRERDKRELEDLIDRYSDEGSK